MQAGVRHSRGDVAAMADRKFKIPDAFAGRACALSPSELGRRGSMLKPARGRKRIPDSKLAPQSDGGRNTCPRPACGLPPAGRASGAAPCQQTTTRLARVFVRAHGHAPLQAGRMPTLQNPRAKFSCPSQKNSEPEGSPTQPGGNGALRRSAGVHKMSGPYRTTSEQRGEVSGYKTRPRPGPLRGLGTLGDVVSGLLVHSLARAE
jgi:hypothetical protein